MDNTYTISEVATKLGISDKTLRRWEDSGKFHTTRTLGNQRRYSLEDLQILDAIKHGIIESQTALLTLPQAASLCGVSPSSIERWVKEGKVHPFITSGKTYYPRARLISKLDELAKNNTPEPTPNPEPSPSTGDTMLSPHPPPTPPTPTVGVDHRVDPSPNNSLESTPLKLSPLLTNFLITLFLILAYHLLTTIIVPTPPLPSSPQTTIAIATPPPQPSITTQDSLTSRQLNLLPTTPPKGVPGALYFDAGSSSLRLFTDTWTDLSPPTTSTTPLTPKDTTLIAGAGNLKKGTDNTLINNKHVTPATPITITFTSDYSPGKKYWLEQDQGSFTLHTDFPVGQNSTFTYLILAPALPEPESATDSPTVF